MEAGNWHSDFNPSKFLNRVNWAQLVERNQAYNENAVYATNLLCILCGKANSTGILLNDKSFLCQECYAEVALISYPRKYEILRRQFVVATESRRLAWESFWTTYAYEYKASVLVHWGWASLLFLLMRDPWSLILTAILLMIGYTKNHSSRQKANEWIRRREAWAQSNPEPPQPVLKHFHDPTAELTLEDHKILRIFNHWPGYPPFWKYLRTVVIARDLNRCQVTGCPSRVELHIHHMRAVADGGPHSPENLVALCSFHHALEPSNGHERIWSDIKTNYFTLVHSHERSNRTSEGTHSVRAHLRRLQLVTMDDLRVLSEMYGLHCPGCGDAGIRFALPSASSTIVVECPKCRGAVEGPRQLAEESGPRLAEILVVSRNAGRWKPRWDVLSERTSANWGTWHGSKVADKRKRNQVRIEAARSAPICPRCGSAMRLVKPRPTDNWSTFWGCTQYFTTGCRGSEHYNAKGS